MEAANWPALAKAAVARRVELGYASRDSFAEAVEIAPRTLGDIERGKRTSYRPSLLARLERALQWPPGTVDAILNGLPAPESRPKTPTPFGLYLLSAINERGTTPRALAEVADLDQRAIHRLIYDDRPSLRVLRHIAPTLGVPEAELVARAYPHGDLVEATLANARRLSTLALLVDAAVGEDSPLTDEERQKVATLVEYVLAPYEQRLAEGIKRRHAPENPR